MDLFTVDVFKWNEDCAAKLTQRFLNKWEFQVGLIWHIVLGFLL